ncbi:19917_t:CDS:2 [Rhizophagus irregularis]|nr:19917_t:CDS:2 [Rhizophagus irregularis]
MNFTSKIDKFKKTLTENLAVDYKKGILQFKELISNTCETASITTVMLYNNSADEIELKEPDDKSDIDKDEDNNDNIERAEFDFTYN